MSRESSPSGSSTNPARIIHLAVGAGAATGVSLPIWDSIRRHPEASDAITFDEILSQQSRAFLETIRARDSKINDISSKPFAYIPADQQNGPMYEYRPFSTIPLRDSPKQHTSRKSQSFDDLTILTTPKPNIKLSGSPMEKMGGMSDGGGSSRIDKQVSNGIMRDMSDPWEDFRKIGFGESPVSALSLSHIMISAPSTPVETTGSGTFVSPAGAVHARHESQAAPPEMPSTPCIGREDVIEMDPLFVSFVEDGQLDATATTDWPSFTLLRLKQLNPSIESTDKPIDSLLVTVDERQRPARQTIPDKQVIIPSRPSLGAISSASRSKSFSLRDITGSFRRSGSFGLKGGLRKSFFGASGRSSGEALAPLSETGGVLEYQPALSPVSSPSTITEMGVLVNPPSMEPALDVNQNSTVSDSVITEMGGTIKPPSTSPSIFLAKVDESTHDFSQGTSAPEPAITEMGGVVKPSSTSSSNVIGQGIEPTHDVSRGTAASAFTISEMGGKVKHPSTSPSENIGTAIEHTHDVSGETAVSDWVYKAEGGAHIVFSYLGSSSAYRGKVLRVRKSSLRTEREVVEAEWRDVLLRRIFPYQLLPNLKEVKVEGEWLHQLFCATAAARPKARRLQGPLLSSETFKSRKAYLVEDIAPPSQTPGIETVLGVEIKVSYDPQLSLKGAELDWKPKWAFLPSPHYLRPPESIPIKSDKCRFCMHQHMRGSLLDGGPRYCPLDLYSGNEKRMADALEGLQELWLTTNGKGNNWLIFLDGKEIFPKKVHPVMQ